MKKTIYLLLLTLVLFGCTDRDWNKAKKENTIKSYSLYVLNNPDGKHVEEAKEKIAELNEKDNTEKQLWELAEKENTIEAYKKYLEKYPAGIYSDLAKENTEKIKKLDNGEEDLWVKTEEKGDVYAYNEYLLLKPEGKYSEIAVEKRKKLFIELLNSNFKEIKDFFNTLKGLDFNDNLEPVYTYFSEQSFTINNYEVNGEVRKEKLISEKNTDYNKYVMYLLDFAEPFFENNYTINNVDLFNDEITVELNFEFTDDSKTLYTLSITFWGEYAGKLKITEIDCNIQESGATH